MQFNRNWLGLISLLLLQLYACSSGTNYSNTNPAIFLTPGLNYTATYTQVEGENCSGLNINANESVAGYTVPTSNTLVAPFGIGPQYTMNITSGNSLCATATLVNVGAYSWISCNYTSSNNSFSAGVITAGCTANLVLSQTPVNSTFVESGAYTATISNATSGCSNLNLNNGSFSIVALNNPNQFTVASWNQTTSTTFNNNYATCMTFTTSSATINFVACNAATSESFTAVINASAPNAATTCMANILIN